ncbi:hypothetical protein AKO1_005590 [Acrasis kona]|uniref:Uncharacterized protein n=1 Tax=Acrasis kona TaxID=1008807 RepID=A0AAW2YJL0_9EUKA
MRYATIVVCFLALCSFAFADTHSADSAFAKRYDISLGKVSGQKIVATVEGRLEKVCGNCDLNGNRTCKYVIIQNGCEKKKCPKTPSGIKKCIKKNGKKSIRKSNCPTVLCPEGCNAIQIVKKKLPEGKCKVCECKN